MTSLIYEDGWADFNCNEDDGIVIPAVKKLFEEEPPWNKEKNMGPYSLNTSEMHLTGGEKCLMENGFKIDAIKSVRSRYNTDLSTAKRLCDSYLDSQPKTTAKQCIVLVVRNNSPLASAAITGTYHMNADEFIRNNMQILQNSHEVLYVADIKYVRKPSPTWEKYNG